MLRRLFASAANQAAKQRRTVDLRSDTVTKPSSAMMQAMMEAELGDDVWGDDPSVISLETYAANLFGKDSAIFVPSGTMGNLIAIGLHCARGEELIVGRQTHIFHNEAAGASAYMGASFFPLVETEGGELRLEDIEDAVRITDPHYPRTALVCLETTHNQSGGKCLPLPYLDAVSSLCASELKLPLHIDGARIMHAAVAQGEDVSRLVRGATTVSVCLSKGLGAPVGSVLVGPADLIERARFLRKGLGGGMRQSGVLAAAGEFALRHNVTRLAEDHARAKRLAASIQTIPRMRLSRPGEVETNIVYFELDEELDHKLFMARLSEEHDVLVGDGYGKRGMRAITHLDMDDEGVDRATAAIEQVMSTMVNK